MAAVMWVGGISAIVAIVGIFIFITKEGAGFFATAFEVEEFLGSPLWRPTSEENPHLRYARTHRRYSERDVVLMAVPFSFGAAIYISEFAPPKTKETLKVLVELLAAIPSVVWGFIGLTIMNPLIIEVFEVPSDSTS